MFSRSEQVDARAHVGTVGSPGHRSSNIDLNDTASGAHQSRSMTGFSYSRSLTDSDSDLEPRVPRSIPDMERPVPMCKRDF